MVAFLHKDDEIGCLLVTDCWMVVEEGVEVPKDHLVLAGIVSDELVVLLQNCRAGLTVLTQ